MVSRDDATSLADVLLAVAADLESGDVSEWNSQYDMLSSTINNITHDFSNALYGGSAFFPYGKLYSVETMPPLGDIVILRGQWELPELEPLFNLAKELHTGKNGKPPLFILLAPGQEISTIEEDQMALFGWKRAEGAER